MLKNNSLTGYEGLAVAIVARAYEDAQRGDKTAAEWLHTSPLVTAVLEHYNMPWALVKPSVKIGGSKTLHMPTAVLQSP